MREIWGKNTEERSLEDTGKDKKGTKDSGQKQYKKTQDISSEQGWRACVLWVN